MPLELFSNSAVASRVIIISEEMDRCQGSQVDVVQRVLFCALILVLMVVCVQDKKISVWRQL